MDDAVKSSATTPPANEPLVSVIMPAHNSAQWLRASVASVVAQSLADWELIIVDDASGDATPELIREWMGADKRIRGMFHTENKGAGATRNTAIEAARGRYLAFLDSDDAWAPNKLERQVEFMRANDYAFTYTYYEKVNARGERLGDIRAPAKVAYAEVLKHCCMGTSSVMIRRDRFSIVRMPELSHGEDHVLWLSLLKETPFAHCLPQALMRFLVRSDSLSSNKLHKARRQWSVYRRTLGIPFFASLWYWLHYAYHGAIKYRR